MLLNSVSYMHSIKFNPVAPVFNRIPINIVTWVLKIGLLLGGGGALNFGLHTMRHQKDPTFFRSLSPKDPHFYQLSPNDPCF